MPTVSHPLPSEHDLELLSAYLDGELTDREREEVEQHLLHESELRVTLEELRHTVALVQSLPDLKAPRNFTLDPATFKRKTPWWQRAFGFESRLELAGMLGTTASIVLILFAVLLSQDSRTANPKVEPQAGANEAIAITNAQPTTLATLLTSEPTAIAFSGDQFQATLSMQSAYFGGTETAVAPIMAAAAPAAVPIATTAFPSPALGMIDETADAQAPMPDGGTSSDTVVGAGGGAAGEDFSPHMATAQAPGSNDNLPPEAQGFTASSVGASTGAYEGETEVGFAGAPAPETTTMKQPTEAAAAALAPDSSASAFRNGATTATREATPEVQENDADHETQASEETTADLIPAFTSTPAEVAQVEAPAERRTVETGNDLDLWWLAGLGAVMLAISMIVFLAGRRRARS